MKLQRVAAAMPFAQLLGLAKRAEDDDDAKRARRAEEEDDDKKAAAADDHDGDEDGDEEGRKAKRARAEEDDDDADKKEDAEDEGDDREDDDADSKKSRKAKSKGSRAEDDEDQDEDGGDDGDEEGKKTKSARGAVRRERARCAAIIAHGVAIGSVRQACVLAFDTSMAVKAAKASLNACKADGGDVAKGGLADRMAAAAVPNIGADAGGATPPSMTKVAAAIVAAGEKARGAPARK